MPWAAPRLVGVWDTIWFYCGGRIFGGLGFVCLEKSPEEGRMGDWQLSGLAHIYPPFLLLTSRYTHRARTGNLWRFHYLKKSAWVVCHIKSRLQHNQGLRTAPWLIICWYFLFSLKQHTDCISHKALWRLVYSPLQIDCSPLCHKVNFIVFVHFPNLQITSSCTLITYYWKNRPSIFPLCFQFEYSLYYLDDLNLFFPPTGLSRKQQMHQQH